MDDASPIFFDADGQPRSRLYDDVYFSRDDGLGEARAVFLQGCGLPQAWRGRRRFTVGELGFGTGLNIVALLDPDFALPASVADGDDRHRPKSWRVPRWSEDGRRDAQAAGRRRVGPSQRPPPLSNGRAEA